MGVITAKTIEKQIAQIDVFLQRLMRRSKKCVAVAMPAIPLTQFISSTSSDEKIRCMFPIAGTITAIVAAVDSMPSRTNLVVTIKLIQNGITTSQQYTNSTGTYSQSLDLSVLAGDRVEIDFSSDNEEAAVEEIWAAFAWTPASEASVVERLAIDALDELQETFISEEE